MIAIGTSWGGLDAISRLLGGLHDDVHQPIVVAQHRSAGSERGALEELLQHHTRRLVSDPDDKTPLEPDHVYLAPPDYHVLVEDGHLALSMDAPVQFARPSIDVGTQPDTLNLITHNAYAGHPNPARGECVWGGGTPYSPPMAPKP